MCWSSAEVRELAKYNTIQKIDVVEVDPLLVEVCRKYFPQIASSLDDDRVTIYNEDGLRFVRSRSDVYDLILIVHQIRLVRQRDCLQRNFTATVTMPCMKMGS